MKKVILISGAVLLLSSVAFFSYAKYQAHQKEEKIKRQTILLLEKGREINECTPEDLTLTFLDHCNNNEVFKQYSSDMINSQIGCFYRTDAEDKIKLCVDILFFKVKGFKQNEDVKQQIRDYIDKLKFGKKDKLDTLLVETFESACSSYSTWIEYESKTRYPSFRF
jgi:hypothetical protein